MSTGLDVGCRTRVRILRRDKRAVIVHHADDRGTWATHDREILYRPAGGDDWRRIGRFPFARPRDLFAWSRPTRRAMRVDKCNLFPTRAGKLLGIRAGAAYRIGDRAAHPLFRIQGDCVLHGGIAETATGNVYFGEYFMNGARGAVNIWRVSSDLADHAAAYTFPAGKIRHVHGVYVDPCNAGRLWATLGDHAGECYLVVTDNEFNTIDWIGDGSQLWRAVRLFFTDTSVCWLTDSNLEQNYAVSMDRQSCQLTVHAEVESSSWYGARTSDGVFLAATTVERGPGVKTDAASVMASKDGVNWQPVLSFKKDPLPKRLFKYGVISFPSGSFGSDSFWISGEGLVGLDGCSLLCCLDHKAGHT